MTNDSAIANFYADDNRDSFKFKQKISGVIGDIGTKNAEIMVSLKYLSNF